MIVELQLWQLISLLVSFLGCIFAFGKVLMAQFDKRLDERFKGQDKALDEIKADNKKAQEEIKADNRADAEQWRRVEREVLQLRADLPLQYVRREDYIRGQTVLETKMDALALKIENMQLKASQGAANVS